MDAFFSSTAAVAIAEIGDKTQLLALFLAARYGRPWVITLGVLLATLINHALSAWFGSLLTGVIPDNWLAGMVGVSFILIGLWLLIPDKDPSSEHRFIQLGPFMATFLLFFLAEIGDKTQIATVVLAAKYAEDIVLLSLVIAGTTLGMLIANVPVIFAGKWIMERLPLAYTQKAACLLFIVMGIITLVSAFRV